MKHNWQIQIQNNENKCQLSRAINYLSCGSEEKVERRCIPLLMNHRVPLYYTLICTELCRLRCCCVLEVLQVICSRQWQKSAVRADSAVCTQQPPAVIRHSLPVAVNTTPPPAWRCSPWPYKFSSSPFPGTSERLETKLATQKAPASAPSGGLPNIRTVRSWSKNGKSSENRVDGASPALTGRGRKGNYNTAEVCLKTYWFVLVSQRQIWWKIWLQIVFTAPGDNLTPSTLSTQMQNCSFGLVWPLVYRESYYPSTPFPPFQSRSSLRTIHNLILSELVMAYLCCSYQTITNQQFPLTRKWGWSILAQNLCLPSFSLTPTFSVLGCYVPKRKTMNRIK